jgi:acyl-CoA synthetase
MPGLLTLHDPRQALRYHRDGHWQDETLYDLVRSHAFHDGGGMALRDSRVRLSWRALLAQVDAFAASLHEAGLATGDRVAVWLPSRAEAVVAMLACSRNGYVCCPSLHQNHTVSEIAGLLERMSCKALVAMPGHGADSDRADIFAVAGADAAMKAMFFVPTSAPAAAPEQARPFAATRAGTVSRGAETNPDKVTYIAFTSGTTGTPKGVMHSDNTLLANGRQMARDWSLDETTVLLTLSPVSHHIATVALEQSLVTGCELVLNDPGPGKSTLDWVEETGATYVMGVPTHAMDLLSAMAAAGRRRMGDVRYFYMAGAPIPPETAERFLRIGVTPQNVYGMTENGSHQYTLPTDPVDVITGTCGRACGGYEVRLFNPDKPDEETPEGGMGEIASRGAQLMLGYFDDQKSTERSFNAAGWFLSGDLGQFVGGNLKVVGRKKDLIIRGGHNIQPAHIEGLAHRHPAVQKAAAFAVPDERLGERVCLAILPAAGKRVEAGAMLEHLAAQGLSKYDMPEYFIAMESFPLTASGKILKRELTDWVKSGRIAPAPVRWTPTKRAG